MSFKQIPHLFKLLKNDGYFCIMPEREIHLLGILMDEEGVKLVVALIFNLNLKIGKGCHIFTYSIVI